MKTTMLGLLLVLVLLAPGFANASLEMGTTSVIGVNTESGRWSLGLGLGLEWRTMKDIYMVIPADTFLYSIYMDATLFILRPAVSTRYFLTTNEAAQPFLVARIERDIPVASSDVDWFADDLEDQNDDWRFGVGGGIRSRVNDHFAVGGEVVARTEWYSYAHGRTQVRGATDFLVFVQYRP